MQKIVTIIEVENRKGKNPPHRDYRVAQCMLHGDGIRVGELWVFDDKWDLTPGRYEIFYEVGVSFDRQIGPQLSAIKPYTGAMPAPAGEAKKAA